MATLQGKTLFITGATRGIGHAIGVRAAQDGANIVIAAKTTEPHPRLPGTIYSAAEDMEKAGGRALALPVDVRDDAGLRDAMAAAAEAFGGIDILVNNASALSLTDTPATPMRRYDLIMGINTRGTFAATQAALPWLREAANPHILTLSPPLDLNPKWFRDTTAYTISKFGMSMCVIGHAAEFAKYGIAVNGLWPKTFISTAALKLVPGMDWETARTPEILADCAHIVLTRDAKTCTGNLFIDEDVLASEGVTDLDKYRNHPDKPLAIDFFVERVRGIGPGAGRGTDTGRNSHVDDTRRGHRPGGGGVRRQAGGNLQGRALQLRTRWTGAPTASPTPWWRRASRRATGSPCAGRIRSTGSPPITARPRPARCSTRSPPC